LAKGFVDSLEQYIAKNNQWPWLHCGLQLNESPSCITSYISLSFVLFLEYYRKCYNVLYAHNMNECSGMLQDHSCHIKSSTKGVDFLMTGSVLSYRLIYEYSKSVFHYICLFTAQLYNVTET